MLTLKKESKATPAKQRKIASKAKVDDDEEEEEIEEKVVEKKPTKIKKEDNAPKLS